MYLFTIVTCERAGLKESSIMMFSQLEIYNAKMLTWMWWYTHMHAATWIDPPHMCTCMHAGRCIHACTHTHTCIHAHSCTHTRAHTHTHTCTHTEVSVFCMCIYIHWPADSHSSTLWYSYLSLQQSHIPPHMYKLQYTYCFSFTSFNTSVILSITLVTH